MADDNNGGNAGNSTNNDGSNNNSNNNNNTANAVFAVLTGDAGQPPPAAPSASSSPQEPGKADGEDSDGKQPAEPAATPPLEPDGAAEPAEEEPAGGGGGSGGAQEGGPPADCEPEDAGETAPDEQQKQQQPQQQEQQHPTNNHAAPETPEEEEEVASSAAAGAAPKGGPRPPAPAAEEAAQPAAAPGNGVAAPAAHAAAAAAAANPGAAVALAGNGVAAAAPLSVVPAAPAHPFVEAHRTELVRLTLQMLRSLGHEGSARELERESGVQLQEDFVSRFRDSVLCGDWRAAKEGAARVCGGDAGAEKKVHFALARQQYLEELETGSRMAALKVLREELTPSADPSRPADLHGLTCLLTCPDKLSLRRRLGPDWDGGDSASSRLGLLRALHEHIPPELLLEENRLCTLLQQAQQLQKDRCVYLNDEGYHTLLHDWRSDESTLPVHTQSTLSDHRDEVWHIEFSHNGRYLASASCDRTVLLYDLQDFIEGKTRKPPVLHRLEGHRDAVTQVAFSPDDTHVLTCSMDATVILWAVGSGRQVHHFKGHDEAVSACAWLPSGNAFFTAAVDRRVIEWDRSGKVIEKWHVPRVLDLCVTPDGKNLVTIDSEKQITVYDLTRDTCGKLAFPRCAAEVPVQNDVTVYEGGYHPNDPVLFVMQESDYLTSCSLSRCGRFLLCGVAVKESRGYVQLYDLHLRRRVRRYTATKQVKFVLRSAFGGATQNFVVSGSEDGKVVILHRQSGQLLASLPGHLKSVNCVAWNPQYPGLLASCSDDKTVRLWTPLPSPPPSVADEEMHSAEDDVSGDGDSRLDADMMTDETNKTDDGAETSSTKTD
ncbi:putative WD repeat-containing protein [Diplonema papillatum]|nr:putative WD repeat-containing protein [Diplonema papillatum]